MKSCSLIFPLTAQSLTGFKFWSGPGHPVDLQCVGVYTKTLVRGFLSPRKLNCTVVIIIILLQCIKNQKKKWLDKNNNNQTNFWVKPPMQQLPGETPLFKHYTDIDATMFTFILWNITTSQFRVSCILLCHKNFWKYPVALIICIN